VSHVGRSQENLPQADIRGPTTFLMVPQGLLWISGTIGCDNTAVFFSGDRARNGRNIPLF
jgi:hypothetical protein